MPPDASPAATRDSSSTVKSGAVALTSADNTRMTRQMLISLVLLIMSASAPNTGWITA